MHAIEFKRFDKWVRVATRPTLDQARTFIAERAPIGRGSWVSTTRVVCPDGSIWVPGMRTK